ncbi:hypothetical protein PanWU01x14_304590 [Parasponia andersonii]|uniref:Uncharacterized protein n=1 Tax=Parasponia andersonii TaxID=3476 RepID=A0A2P5ASH4_PARAD|nr:hypothetical protein PanWU01x14_304590 [Parasponia andersonii]
MTEAASGRQPIMFNLSRNFSIMVEHQLNTGQKFQSMASTPVENIRSESKFSGHRLKNDRNNWKRWVNKFDHGRNFQPNRAGAPSLRSRLGLVAAAKVV